ncbi:hypothetical protein [Chryseobacterium indoltheticum]|uniref:Uncharacterized protein n=1 Tax=Chryseobacterium indoltheticum TaxID=254 RepID=A0A381FLU6_9FLAO|nr:hypothetical protein [Chryseobacterium indoltheticum]SUX47182.1 Uncharacterised protein [Chryseobacterium indoltheticum]
MSTPSVPLPLSKFETLLLIPEAIHFEEVKQSSILYSSKIHPDKLLSLLSLITIELTSFNYEKDRHETSKKVKIHSNILKEICGKEYPVYIAFLLDSNILSVRSPYDKMVKGQSFGYGFKAPYSFQRLKLIRRVHEKAILPENNFKDSYVEKCEKILYGLFDRTKFSTDYNIAEENLFGKYLGNIKFPIDSENIISWNKYSAYHGGLVQLLKLLNGEYTFIRKKKPSGTKPSGRFYSPLTFLNKIIRSSLYYEGKKLHQLDVKNMFPYLLSQYLPQLAVLDSERVERLQSCPAFKAKYNLKTNLYTPKDYIANQLLEQFIVERYGSLILPKSKSGIPNIKLVQQDNNKYFFLDKPKNLFQDSVSHFQKSNKKFYYRFIHNSQRENWNQSPLNTSQWAWKIKGEQETQKGNCTNSYSQIKGINNNSHLATLYTETFKGSNITRQLNLPPKEYSNYISNKILETLMNKEIFKFNTLSTKGIIYDHFIGLFKNDFLSIEWAIKYKELFDKDYNEVYEQDRELTKKLFIAMLYARNNNYIKEQRIFKSEFPILYDLIREKKKGNHKIITNKLFELEAEIIVDKVARGLIKKNIKTFTIHDCIAIQEENIDFAKDYMKEIFLKKFGNYPVIKLEL